MMVSAENDPRKAGTIWSQNLADPSPEIRPQIPARFSRLTPESIPTLAAAMGASVGMEFMRRLETGRRCYVAYVHGELAAYGWVSFEEEFVGELRLRLKLLPGEAYIWDCVTLPAYRQKHFYSALLVYILGELRSEQLCRAWIGANLDNTASQLGIARAGFQRVGDLLIQRVLALRLVWVQGRPDVPDSLVAEARRVFLGNRDQVWMSALSAVIRP